MTQPSRFIFNSDYATTKNDDFAKFTVTIPSTFVCQPNSSFTVVNQEYEVGQKAASMRWMVSSDKYPNSSMPNPSTFNVPCHIDITNPGGSYSVDSILVFNVYRSSPRKIRIKCVVWDEIGETTQTFSNCGQTLTISVASFLNPLVA